MTSLALNYSCPKNGLTGAPYTTNSVNSECNSCPITNMLSRLTYKSSSKLHEREARAVDFYVFCGKSERESESSTTGTGNERRRTLRKSTCCPNNYEI